MPPDPKNGHAAFVVTDNGPFNPGAAMQIDVTGDTDIGVSNVGRGPRHATLVGTHLAVANTIEDTVTVFLSNVQTPSTVTLVAGSTPVFVHSAETATFYVANQGSVALSVLPSVSVVNAITSQVIQSVTLPGGSIPVALAEMPNAQKVYVANQVTNSVVSINVVDKSLNTPITDSSISKPVWAVARGDSARVYVLSHDNGNLAVIDTNAEALIPNTISVGAGANFVLYDGNLNRLYITNPVAGTVTILNATADPPTVLATINVTTSPNAHCPAGCMPLSVAALPDGSRAYVASLQCASLTGGTCMTGTTATTYVTVISALDNAVTKTIALPPVTALANCASIPFRLSAAAGGDSSRFYVANCDAGSVSIVNTSGDILVANNQGQPLALPAPVSAAAPPPGSTQPPPQNPVFMVAGP
jgi:hypothetical protein